MDLRVISSSKLYVSEPDPRWFGNGPNDAANPHWTNANWLKSRFHFSFAEYSNPRNDRFGVLRVMNDDLVQPDRGFGTHPHRDMEIVTYVVEGELTHADSMGSAEALGRGSIQFMSAGRGVMHSERNASPDTPLRFIQTWILPSARGLAPRYGSRRGRRAANKLQHLVASLDWDDATDDDKTDTEEAPVRVHQDVDAYAAELELGRSVAVDLPAGRQAYLLCLEGGLALNGGQARLGRHDACEVTRVAGGGAPLTVEATAVEDTEHGPLAHFLVFTMPEEPGAGRGDL